MKNFKWTCVSLFPVLGLLVLAGCSSNKTPTTPQDTPTNTPVLFTPTNTGTPTPSDTPTQTPTSTVSPTPTSTPVMLIIIMTGAGTGTVSDTTGQINNCSGPCTAYFPKGYYTTISAVASAGSTFGGWAGGGCAGTNPCAVPVNANTTVFADFAIWLTPTVTPSQTPTPNTTPCATKTEFGTTNISTVASEAVGALVYSPYTLSGPSSHTLWDIQANFSGPVTAFLLAAIYNQDTGNLVEASTGQIVDLPAGSQWVTFNMPTQKTLVPANYILGIYVASATTLPSFAFDTTVPSGSYGLISGYSGFTSTFNGASAVTVDGYQLTLVADICP